MDFDAPIAFVKSLLTDQSLLVTTLIILTITSGLLYGSIGLLLILTNPIFIALGLWAFILPRYPVIRDILRQYVREVAMALHGQGFSPEIEQDTMDATRRCMERVGTAMTLGFSPEIEEDEIKTARATETRR